MNTETENTAEPEEFSEPAAMPGERYATNVLQQSRAAIEKIALVEIAMAVLSIEGIDYEPPRTDSLRAPAFDGRLTRQDAQCAALFSWGGKPILKIRWWPGCTVGKLDIEAERLYQRPVSIAMREIELVPDASW
jgi:hypothetical protein